MIPVWSPAARSLEEVSLYQIRPDRPGKDKTGRPNKYLTPPGSRMALDVPPAKVCREKIGDPASPLFITEGIKKGDALATRGLCSLAMLSVWGWRGTNSYGGKTALPDWEHVAVNGRETFIVYDSDVMTNSYVFEALRQFKDFLENRGATVKLIYLPPAEDGGKQGVDDYLAAGHGVGELLSRATTELRRPPDSEESAHSIPYRATKSGIVWDKPVAEGSVPTPLTNFTARICADVAEDDGAEVRRSFEIEAELAGRRQRFTIPSSQFNNMGWATENLGASAIVLPGFGTKDHARAAVQLLSGEVPTRHIYSHTGWREIEGSEWAYLHAGGAVGQVGQVESTQVELSGALAGRALPEPPEGAELAEAVRASLGLWKLVPAGISVPLLAATYRAALGDSDFSAHLSGPTGEGKSELAALCQQHYGAGLDSRHLASWESTENAVQGQAFQAKDQVMVLDDFAPTGSTYDVQRWHTKADRVLRAKGNASARQRMRADTTLRPDKPPRALMVSTGEDVPRGQSLRARMMILELGPGELDFEKLSRCQQQAAAGTYARAMAAFVRWLAPRYGEVRASLPEEHAVLREAASASGQHRRTPGIVADLVLGLRYLLVFAHQAGALTEEEARDLWQTGWKALGEAAAAQGEHQSSQEPTKRFRELLSAAISSGRAHVTNEDGERPRAELAGSWGWRRREWESSGGEEGGSGGQEWKPQGDHIGWIDDGPGGTDLYLQPDAAFAAGQKQGQSSGDALSVTERTLRKRLSEKGLLLSTGKESEGRQTLAVRVTLSGKRRMVLHLDTDFLLSQHEKPDQPDHGEQNPHTYAPNLWSGRGTEPDHNGQKPDHGPDQEPDHALTKRGKPDQEGTLFSLDDTPSGSPPEGRGQVSPGGWSGSGQVFTPNLTTAIPDTCAENGSGGQVGQVLFRGREGNCEEGAAAPLITEAGELEKVVSALDAADTVALDTETTGLDPRRDQIRLLQLATAEDTYVVDCFEVDPSPVLESLKDKNLIAHNALYDLSMLAEGYGYEHRGDLFDTMIASRLLYAGSSAGPDGKKPGHSLAAVAERELGTSLDKEEQTADWSGEITPEMAAYAGSDAQVLPELYRRLSEKLEKAGLSGVMELEMGALPAVLWMSLSGVPVDEAGWRERAFHAEEETVRLSRKLDELAGKREDGKPWNWNSWQHVIRAAKEAGIELPDTKDETLSRYASDSELIRLLREYRAAKKLASTYGAEWLDGKNSGTSRLNEGRVYPSWWQVGAATGRMACSSPNLQNVPSDLRRFIRPAANAGRVLIAADYSQIELRIAARIAGEERMLRAYNDGEDLHSLTARGITSKEEITKEDRKLAKAVNFGLLYGMGARGLAEYARGSYGIEMSEDEAASYRRAFFETYPGLASWHRRERHGSPEARTLAGRRRLEVQRFTDRLNTPVQGTGADGLKAALSLLWERREECPSAAPVMVIHDEVVVECNRAEADKARVWLERAMVDGMDTVLNTEEPHVPVEVEAETKENWGG